jgi:RNA polymerase sigma-70 factor, ECF subfamily
MTDDRAQHLGQLFESERDHLRAVAYRMLGDATEAEDAVQESWLRLNRSDAGAIENLGGWLTTVVARVCLDMLRARKARREESLDSQLTETVAESSPGRDPGQEAVLADSVGFALLAVLDTLTPAERLTFVMHDMFDVSFDEIASIIGKSPAAARQLASRARRRVRGAEKVERVELHRQRKVVDAFLAALRAGDFEGLLAVLDPDLVFTRRAGRSTWCTHLGPGRGRFSAVGSPGGARPGEWINWFSLCAAGASCESRYIRDCWRKNRKRQRHYESRTPATTRLVCLKSSGNLAPPEREGIFLCVLTGLESVLTILFCQTRWWLDGPFQKSQRSFRTELLQCHSFHVCRWR